MEKTKWPPSFAAVKRLATNADRLSESPNCMLGLLSMLKWWMDGSGEVQTRLDGDQDAGHVIAWDGR